jgi:hypothetical protein
MICLVFHMELLIWIFYKLCGIFKITFYTHIFLKFISLYMCMCTDMQIHKYEYMQDVI